MTKNQRREYDFMRVESSGKIWNPWVTLESNGQLN